jgi:hypothetical protein
MYKQIKEFPAYEVSEQGEVRRIKNKKPKKAQTYLGYKCVMLYNGGKGKWQKVHRLVAEAFIDNPNSLPFINHKDENKLNNNVGNLEWCDSRYNNSYGENAPVKKMKLARIKNVMQLSVDGCFIAEYESACEAQRKTGIAQSNISKCCLRRKGFETAGGYRWAFASQIK